MAVREPPLVDLRLDRHAGNSRVLGEPGHVAVVSQVIDSRQVLVTQANWVHHRVTGDQPVIDVSATNSWSTVRVWWPPTGAMGVNDYPAYGFIRAGRPATHDQIVAGTPRAIRLAANE